MTNSDIKVAMAILYQNGRFLMQLRDDFPHILFPGHWGLFGGHLEPGETAEQGLQRELWEEITYIPPLLTLFNCYGDSDRNRYIYHAPLAVGLDQLVQNEGQDLALVTPEDIRLGYAYSAKINQSRPLGQPHRRMLLDFINFQKV